jgi:ATP-dependent Clp protease ATP-binding subunit ClpC
LIPRTVEFDEVLAQARDIALLTQHSLGSAHVLLALFTVPNRAEALLLDRRINEETVLAHIDRMQPEPTTVMAELLQRATAEAHAQHRPTVGTLEVLAALTGMAETFACQLLTRTGVDLARLREDALNAVQDDNAALAQPVNRRDRAIIDAGLTGYVRDTMEAPALPADGRLPVSRVVESVRTTLEAAELVEADAAQAELEDEDEVELVEADGRQTIEAPALDKRGLTGFTPQQVLSETERRSGIRGRRRNDRRAAGDADRRRRLSAQTATEPDEDAPSPFVLNRERFKWLTRLGRNLSHLAWLGKLDPVIGREAEIVEAVDILNKRRSNNPCLVGEPGVGKTAIAEGIAAQLVADHPSDAAAPERVLIQVDVGAILAGTHLRGALAERLRGLQDEVRAASGRVIVFIDEIHTLIGAGGGDGGGDAANELKAALARGEFPCIGATTNDEFKQHIENDPALERRFTSVHIEAPDAATTRRIIAGVAERYAAHHNVPYTQEALDTAVRLARRYIHDRNDPDRTLGVLDLAGAVARRGTGRVDRRAVCEVIARTARVPLEHLLMDDPQRFLNMEDALGEAIVGQKSVLGALSETIRRNFAGFAGARPIGSFLFLGPTGVGKTQMVKALAQFLFGHVDALTRFDMSEFLEAHSVARLIGSPPGYVGHQDGGQLTDAIRRRPYQVVLFDEIEKSHRDVWNVLLQILDEGRLTDSRGRTVDFSNTLVVMTTNLGAELLVETGRRIGFAAAASDDPEARAARALDKARGSFPPELWNRIESRLVFHPLDRDEIRAIAYIMVAERSALLERERDIAFEVSPAAVDLLVESGGYDAQLGARPMRQTIARTLETALADRILGGALKAGDRVKIDAEDGAFTYTVAGA